MTSVQNHCYDIFLSFRGEDTRHTFTGYLYKALCDRGFKTFIDDEGLERGEEISPALIKAIEESKVSIVIFSKNYASSPWCLNELVKILECKRKKGQMVWPIFYKVDPSDVRHQRNSYKEAMDKHENRFKNENEKVQRWKSALNEAANLSGSTFKTGYEFEFITTIIEDASTKLHRKHLYIGEHISGLASQLEDIKALLNFQYDDTRRMLGIHGIGGLGKTTLAKVLYNMIIDHFDCACFLESIQEKSNGSMGQENVQKELLSKMFGKTYFNLGNSGGADMIKHMLCNRRVLLVLDDIDKMEQLEKLAGGCDWFGPGSRIIITTRDKHLLIAHGIEKLYEMKEPDYDQALELFCLKAFKRNQRDESYVHISHQIINYAQRLPLALKIFGSNLFGKSLEVWESALDKYQKTLDQDIQGILRVSYDSLEDDQKNVFLDIACFFKGERLKDVEKILDACDLSPKYNIEMLVDKSLITINEVGVLGMHDLIQDMGKEIVRKDASSKLRKYSRLWNHEAIIDVLTSNSGSDNIQGIMFHPLELEKVEWNGTAFKEMNNLRILIIRNSDFSIGPKGLPNHLRVLVWDRYPSESLPHGFYTKNICVLKLKSSCLISLNPVQNFEKLTCMDLSESQLLTQVPDFSRAPNITTLRLDRCTSLIEVHDSVGVLTKLLDLSLEGCTNLKIFPREIKMTSLERLNLNGCRSLLYFPDIFQEMVNLRYIDATGTGIKQIPHSFCYLPGLELLYISDCYDSVSLPESIDQLHRLRYLFIVNFKKLHQFSRVPAKLEIVPADGCISLTSQSLNSMLSQVQDVKHFYVFMPMMHIPNWFDYCCKGGKLSVWACKNYLEFTFAVVFRKSTSQISSQRNGLYVQILRYDNGRETFNRNHTYLSDAKGMMFLLHERGDFSNTKAHDWNHVEIKCRISSSDYKIDECGVYVHNRDIINTENIRFECPIPNNSNMNTAMSKNDEEPRDLKEEAKPRKRSSRFMSRNDERIDEAKPRKKSRRVVSSNGKQLEAGELPRRFIKKRIGIHMTGWRRKVLAPLFFSKLFKLSSSFHSF